MYDSMTFAPVIFVGLCIGFHVEIPEQMPFPAIRALMLPFFLRPGDVFRINPAASLGCRRRKQPHDPIPESRHSFGCQVYRVAFGASRIGESVHLVGQQNPYRTAGQSGRAVSSTHDQSAAWEEFRQNRVVSIPGFSRLVPGPLHIVEQRTQYGRVADHGSNT